jgi:gas vesicle protein
MASTKKKITESAIFGAVVGFVTGILTAPKSGKETRADIKDATERSIVAAEKELKGAHTKLVELIDKATALLDENKGRAHKQVEDAINQAQKVKQKIRELLSVIHEGDVEDKDLKAAVMEADKAIEHLKSFFSKSDS